MMHRQQAGGQLAGDGCLLTTLRYIYAKGVTMKIALIGYGKMGKLLEQRALDLGHNVVAVVEPFAAGSAAVSGAPVSKTIALAYGPAGDGPLAGADIAVEFTRPETAPENILALVERKIPVLVGTTGWHSRLPEITQKVEEAGSSLLWASNFSLGVNLFYRIAAYAAKIADPFADYDVGGWEAHHNKKADSPSGTAKTLVERVLENMSRKTRAIYDTLPGPPPADAIHFPSLRVGSVPGVHSLFFDSPADTIEITHTARSREGFAAGALRAAEWLVNFPGSERPGPGRDSGAARRGVYTMDDVLADILGCV
jgi:4-hydroxy-tetrahydrodipicolinate reductase